MSHAPTLTDGTVTLRAHRADDAQGSWEQCQDPLSQAWTTVPIPYSMDDAREYVSETMPRGWADDSEWGFAIEADGRYAGSVSLRNEGDGRAELAYGSHPWVRGTGYVERALRLMVEWGFADRDLDTIIWWANKGNWASRKVAWRLGFTFEGTLRRWLPQRGELRDAWVATLLRDDPREPRTDWLTCPVLESGQIRLRSWRHSDAERVVEACSDERTAYWFGRMPSPYTLQDAHDYIETRTEVLATADGIGWAVADRDSDLLLASLGLFDLQPGVAAELGYWTHPDARGRGVMSEAVALALRHAFTGTDSGGLGLRLVSVMAAEENLASRRVVEVNGFRQWGIERLGTTTRDGPVDVARYDLTAEEFTARSPTGG